ncbi:PEP-utilizing enzyme [Vallitalea guaymasensis]|uniref:PEP-utilizing enzyme n=1 Tax=Vallitalea guaymasensis TaxID=1185412 RepID=UPI0023BA3D35|nr:PEP-utilizing enzyme [Vallitalea guaymasensis]
MKNIKEWPLIFDSRGKIINSKIEAKDGDFVGIKIAPGKVTGRAKILRSPYEKPLSEGEILVAKATEPSWTPIFINAAGVVMEVGGPLQHGGIIAREYGIPCVSGLVGIMDILNDGDLIEVDGTNGIVKLVQEIKHNANK